VKVRNRCSRRHDNGDGTFRLDGQTQSEERAHSLVDCDVNVEKLAVSKRGGNERKGLRP
jgi:hypothetical protein